MKRSLTALVLLAVPAAAQETPPTLTVSHLPDVGVIRTVSAGTPVHEYARTLSFDAFTPKIEMRGGRFFIPFVIPAGTPLLRVSSKSKLKACEVNGPCGLDDDGDGVFDRMAEDDVSVALKLKTPVPYEIKRMIEDSPGNLKQLIIYEGASADTIKLSYREFNNNLARPAFTEDITIPIKKMFPQDVAVKDVKIRIHGIDGLGMQYEILP